MKTLVISFDDENEEFENIILALREQTQIKKVEPNAATGQNYVDLRRSRHFSSLAVDFEKRRVLLDTTSIHLTPLEYKLLCFLIKNPGRVFTKQQLLKDVWEYDDGTCKVVSNTVSNLRSKIEADRKNPVYIITVHGGYMFNRS